MSHRAPHLTHEVHAKRQGVDTLAAIRAAAQEKMPTITIADHPYDIGYWACCAGLRIPSRLKIEGSDLGEFRAGWAQADSEE